jgi:agmatinase
MKPWRDLLTEDLKKANVTIAGIALDRNASVGKGAGRAPNRIRKLSGYLPPASKEGVDLTSLKLFDFGNIGHNRTPFSKIETKAAEILDLHKFSVFFGGDHSCSIPLEAAFYDQSIRDGFIPAIIHIDAHPDICDVYDGSKFSHACPNFRAIERGYKRENVVLLAVRGFEIQELELFSKHPEIEVIKASQINELGLEAIRHLKDKFDSRYQVYLSFDIDAIDPSFAPGTGTPEAFGITSQTALKIITYFVENLPVKAMDIMEVSPKLDSNDITSWTALKLLYEVFASLCAKTPKIGGKD